MVCVAACFCCWSTFPNQDWNSFINLNLFVITVFPVFLTPLRPLRSATTATKSCTKSKDSDATCTNCNGTHTANYRGCPNYKKEQAKRRRFLHSFRQDNANVAALQADRSFSAANFPPLPQPTAPTPVWNHPSNLQLLLPVDLVVWANSVSFLLS